MRNVRPTYASNLSKFGTSKFSGQLISDAHPTGTRELNQRLVSPVQTGSSRRPIVTVGGISVQTHDAICSELTSYNMYANLTENFEKHPLISLLKNSCTQMVD